MSMNRVKNQPHLYRDSNSKGVVNGSLAALNEHKRNRNQMQKINEIDAMKNDINNMKGDMKEIKNLLLHLVNKE
jgi:hypothetical protein